MLFIYFLISLPLCFGVLSYVFVFFLCYFVSRELVVFLLSSRYQVTFIVLLLFLMVVWVGKQCGIMTFSAHNRLVLMDELRFKIANYYD